MASFCSVVEWNHLDLVVRGLEIVIFFFEEAVLVGNIVEELLDEKALHNHVDHGHEHEDFTCKVLVEPLLATSCAGKVSMFANEDFSDQDYDNLADR